MFARAEYVGTQRREITAVRVPDSPKRSFVPRYNPPSALLSRGRSEAVKVLSKG